MFSYLKPKDGVVIPGFEQKEVVYAEDQPEYIPLRTLVSNDLRKAVLSRWEAYTRAKRSDSWRCRYLPSDANLRSTATAYHHVG